MPKVIGTAPYQVPTNADLGTMAYQDALAVNIQGGVVNATTVAANSVVANNLTVTSNTVTVNTVNANTANINFLNLAGGANSIVFTNATSNYIAWNTNGIGAPTATSRSAGTKLILYPQISSTNVDYALGIEANHIWFSSAPIAGGFKWYANTTNIATLNTTSFYTSANIVAYSTSSSLQPVVSVQATDQSPKVEVVNYSTSSSRYPQLVATHFGGNSSVAYTGGFPVVELLMARGTSSATVNTSVSDVLGGVNYWGYTGAWATAVRIEGVAESSFTSSGAVRGGWRVRTAYDGTMYERLRVAANGNIGINNATPTDTLSITTSTGTGLASLRLNGTGNATSNSTAFIWTSEGGAILTLDASNTTNPASWHSVVELKGGEDYRAGGIFITHKTAPRAGANAHWYVGKPYTGAAFQIGYGAQPEYQSNSFLWIAAANGNISIGGANTTPAEKLVVTGTARVTGNVIIGGDLTVSGTTTYVNTTQLNIADNIITLNTDFTTGTPTENAGIEVSRGSSANVLIRWNESTDRWQLTNDGTTYYDVGLDNYNGVMFVEDSFTGNGSNTQYTLSRSATRYTASVVVDGLTQKYTTDYTFTDTLLNFTAAPLNNESIVVTHYNGISSNGFNTLIVSGQTTLYANTSSQQLELVGGNNVTITTSSGNTVSFAVNGIEDYAFATGLILG